MADEPKILKTFCKSCSSHMEVEVPEYFVKVVKERCQCGMSSDARVVRYLMFGVASIMACVLGCCAVGHHYNTESIRVLGESGYTVRPATAEERVPNGPEIIVEKKKVVPAPEAPPRGPIDPRAPHPKEGGK